MGRYRDIEEMPDRLYAIGDIHGCADEAGVLLEHLVSSEKIGPRDLVLFIGDYVDRGMQSKQVLDLLIAFRAQYPSTIFLRGNHEDMFLAFLGFDGREGSAYLANGGANCVASYGVPAGGDLVPTREMVQQVIPPEHVAFLRGLERYVITEKFVFVHAGVNPLRDLRAQTDADLYWIRDEFIQNIHYFRKTVVFGHTPYENVLFHLPYKIGIDTGLVYGNRLSCIEVVQRRTLQVEKGGKKVGVTEFPK